MESTNMMDVRNLAIIFGPTLLQPRDNNMIDMVRDMAGQCQIVECVVLNHEWMFSDVDEMEDVTDGKNSASGSNSVVPLTGMDQILLEKAENIVAHEERDGDIRRLLRRVTSRNTKSNRKQRSRSAHGDIRSTGLIERNIDEAIAAKNIAEQKSVVSIAEDRLSQQEREVMLGMAQCRSGSLSRLSSTSLSGEPAAEAEVMKPKHVVQSKTSTAAKVVASQYEAVTFHSPVFRPQRRFTSERVQRKNVAGSSLIVVSRPRGRQQLLADPMSTSLTVMATNQSYHQFSASHQHVTLDSTDCVMSSRTDRMTSSSSHGSMVVNSGQSYLGSAARSSRTLMRERYKPVTFFVGPLSHSPSRDHLSSPEGCRSPARDRHNSQDISVNVSRQSGEFCGNPHLFLSAVPSGEMAVHEKKPTMEEFSHKEKQPGLGTLAADSSLTKDSSFRFDDDLMSESAATPIHLMSNKRWWNTRNCCWEDEPPACDKSSSATATTSLATSWSYFNLQQNRRGYIPERLLIPEEIPGEQMETTARQLVFCRADVSDVSKVSSRARNCRGIKSVKSENDLEHRGGKYSVVSTSELQAPVELQTKRTLKAIENVGTDVGSRHRLHRVTTSPSLRHLSLCSGRIDRRHSDVGIPSLKQPPPVNLYRTLSCPAVIDIELTTHDGSISTRDHRTSLHSRRKESRKSATTGRRRRLEHCLPQCVLPAPTNSSWPGKGDVIGSILTYESSV
jgi:hypothetical protein